MSAKTLRSVSTLRLGLALVLLLGAIGTTGASADEPSFDDIGTTHPFSGAIEWLAAAGITRGCNPPDNTMFCPNDNVTRGQMAAFLVRALNLQTTGSADFTDDDDSIFEDSIEKLAAAGITRGCNPPDNTMFCPNDNVTRGQMAAFLYRALREELLVTPSSLPEGTVGIVYEASVSSAGGYGTTLWTVGSGSLPPGLELDVDGTISGIPTQPGDATFVLTVSDAAGETASGSFDLTVRAPLAITTDVLPYGIRGGQYDEKVEATGGLPPYAWSLESGDLPQGVGLSEDGALSGIPGSSGTWTFTLEVTDESASVESSEYEIVVYEPLAITSAGTPVGVEEDDYSSQFTASGGLAPYTWSVVSGSLPPGTSLSSGGALTGTPTSPGTWVSQVEVEDAIGMSDRADLAITINPRLDVTTATAPEGVYDYWYEVLLTAQGGIGPYSWELHSGSLPDGLSLSSSGWITGTPTTFWGEPFTVSVADQRGEVATRQLSVHITGTLRVSISSFGLEGNDESGTTDPYGGLAVSEDGRYVAFDSYANNLVAGDTNGVSDIFIRDVRDGTTSRVSTAGDGTQGDGESYNPAISDDGRYVGFVSVATDLVAGDGNGAPDVFVHDTWTGATERVSVASDGTEGNNSSFEVTISPSGRYVAFVSDANNLVAGDTNGRRDVFLHDRQTDTTTRVNVTSDEVETNGWARWPDISAGAAYVGFSSDATDVVPGDTTGPDVRDIFIRDTAAGTTSRVLTPGGAEPNGSSGGGRLSDDGRYVAFFSSATNWIAGDTNGHTDIFVHDIATGATEAVTVNNGGTLSNGYSLQHGMSANGRWVTFSSYATNLAGNDTDNTIDVFLRDRWEGRTVLVSRSSYGSTGAGSSRGADISADGNAVAFVSDETQLVPGDSNDTYDVFIRFW